jgi:hypothetical protein
MSDQPYLQKTIPDLHTIDDVVKPQPPADNQLNFWQRRKSGGEKKQVPPKLKEIQYLLPYLLLNLDYGVSTSSMREMQKLVIYDSLKTRAALVD